MWLKRGDFLAAISHNDRLLLSGAHPTAGLGVELASLPVFAGDTIHVVTDVLEARRSRSRPGTGIVTFEHRGLNQRDETVCLAVRAAMMLCQPDQGQPGRDM